MVMANIKHMGFELELVALQIARGLVYVPEDERKIIIKHLTPRKLQVVVSDMMKG
jgi:hypothetical protein